MSLLPTTLPLLSDVAPHLPARWLALAAGCSGHPAVPSVLPQTACIAALSEPRPALAAGLAAAAALLPHFAGNPVRCPSLPAGCSGHPAVPSVLPQTACIAALSEPRPALAAGLAAAAAGSPPALQRAARLPSYSRERP